MDADREIIEAFGRTRDKTLELIEAIPEDRLTRKTEGMRSSLGGVPQHIATADAWRMHRVMNDGGGMITVDEGLPKTEIPQLLRATRDRVVGFFSEGGAMATAYAHPRPDGQTMIHRVSLRLSALFLSCFILVVAMGTGYAADGPGRQPATTGVSTAPSPGAPITRPPLERVFVISCQVRSVEEFDTFAAQAERLKPYGRVEVSLRSLSGKTTSDVPAGGSPWHEYTSYLASLPKFFPPKKMVPFVDMEHVRKNRKLLADCAEVLRKRGLGAAFTCHIPWFLSEGFFEKYPHLRGGRVDHPRRSRQEAYAMCIDQKEAQNMVAGMVAELVQAAGDLGTLTIMSNDAGAGLCWSEWLYPGHNGPANCENVPTVDRVAKLLAAIRRGAGSERPLDIHLYANLTKNEAGGLNLLPDDRLFMPGKSNGVRLLRVGTRNDNPVLGIIDPVSIVRSLGRSVRPGRTKIFVNFEFPYSRGSNLPEAADKVIELIEQYCQAPPRGPIGRLEFLRTQCVRWVGEDQADGLLGSLVSLHETMQLRWAALGKFNANYAGVSMRMITRPLVAVPELLTPEEEAYFLPHVFNISREQARIDYLDFHGGRLAPALGPNPSWPRVEVADRVCGRLSRLGSRLERLKGDGDAKVFRRMGTSLRIYASIIRSIHNFYSVQLIRDRNMDKFAAAKPVVLPKQGSWMGDKDLFLLREFMRNELDNTSELIDILESGGLSQVARAKPPQQEDTFLLGPDLLDQLKTKRAIMRRHWPDAERYFVSPNK